MEKYNFKKLNKLFYNVDPVHGNEKNKYDRTRTGEQGHAPIRDRLPSQKAPKIREQTPEKRGGEACPAVIYKNMINT
ncbi:hypothetical protein [Maribacter ulvicola]|uniref:hypothetical protein n=1 Tax=Maribacter ulvicola TaxID=228959 RepID=UPI0013567325|nr:hypothetical protein [Maribacter ulvicola]